MITFKTSYTEEGNMKTIRDLQTELTVLKKEVFHEHPNAVWNPFSRALNVNEEAGEIAREERIEMDFGQFDEDKAKDAVGDVLISTIGYCIARGFDAQDILEDIFGQLKERWKSGQFVGTDHY